MTTFLRRQVVVSQLKAQMRRVCEKVADDIRIIQAAPIPSFDKPHAIAATEPGRDWAVAPAEWGWPDVRNGSLGATDFRR